MPQAPLQGMGLPQMLANLGALGAQDMGNPILANMVQGYTDVTNTTINLQAR